LRKLGEKKTNNHHQKQGHEKNEKKRVLLRRQEWTGKEVDKREIRKSNRRNKYN
jgi:hypothetical protein